jgi:F420-non-reducing hydrogenase small subunit
MADKIKFGFLLTGGCAGCEMAMVDLSENLLDALEHIDVVFWAPTVADVKYKDLEDMEDNSIDVAFVDGMIRLSEHEHMVRVLRAKSKILVAFGACAALGGIPGMANLHTRDELFNQAYRDTYSTENPDNVLPQPEYLLDGKYDLTLPTFQDKVRTVQDLVEVDYFVGGCPPHHSFVAKAVETIVSGNLPPKGSWLTSGKAVCDVCPRNPANQGQERIPVENVKRTVDGKPEEEGCLLQHGFVCLGPITQGDCGASCLKVNMPCRGCGGPIPGIGDYGARAVSTIGSILKDDTAVESLMGKFPTLSKLVYRYSLPASRLKSNVK